MTVEPSSPWTRLRAASGVSLTPVATAPDASLTLDYSKDFTLPLSWSPPREYCTQQFLCKNITCFSFGGDHFIPRKKQHQNMLLQVIYSKFLSIKICLIFPQIYHSSIRKIEKIYLLIFLALKSLQLNYHSSILFSTFLQFIKSYCNDPESC